MNRIATPVFCLLAAISGAGCGEGTPAALPASPGAPAPLPGPEAPSRGDDDDSSLEIGPEAPGSDEPEPTGGQSGTDSDNLELVFCPDPVPLAADRLQAGVQMSWLIDNAMGRPYVFRGSFLDEPATMEVRMEQSGPAREVHGPGYNGFGVLVWDCDSVDVPVRVSMSIVLAGGDTLTFEGRDDLLTFQPSSGRVILQLRMTDFSNPARLVAALRERYIPPYGPSECFLSSECLFGMVDLQFTYDTAPVARHELVEGSAELEVDAIRESFISDALWRRVSASPADSLPVECAAAEPTQPVSFQNPEAASRLLVGAWALCNQGPYPGVQVFPDGTWQAIMPGDERRLASGFGREGKVTLEEVFEYDSEGNLVRANPPQVQFQLSPEWQWNAPSDWWASQGAVLDASASGNTLGSGLLVRIDPVAVPAAAPLFASGERAGAAGCASAETEIEPAATSEQELRDRLAGRWVGCTGFSGELHFDPEGNLQISRSESYGGGTEPVTLIERSDGGYVLATASQSWVVRSSLRPLKLWLHSGEFGAEAVVLSAVP